MIFPLPSWEGTKGRGPPSSQPSPIPATGGIFDKGEGVFLQFVNF